MFTRRRPVVVAAAAATWLVAPLVALACRGSIEQRVVQAWRDETRERARQLLPLQHGKGDS